MLGESHDVEHEFPEFHDQIEALRAEDMDFSELMDKHDHLDQEIRELEERGQPVADEYMENMKKERALLKDKIYAALRAASG